MTAPAPTIIHGDVRAVFSGDDLMVLVDQGVDGLWKQRRIRLYGVDTPYAKHAKPNSPAGRVRDYVRRLTRDRLVQIEIIRDRGPDWLAVLRVETRDGLVNLNEDLIRQGYAFLHSRKSP
jgi:Staphylococcal nuclease homologue.